jgi:hypothetical protein
MSELTPETVRTLSNQMVGASSIERMKQYADQLDACADAWAAERKERERLSLHEAQGLVIVLELRKRIEAAGLQFEHMRRWSRGDMTGLTVASIADAMMRMCDDGLSALRGEEKP